LTIRPAGAPFGWNGADKPIACMATAWLGKA